MEYIALDVHKHYTWARVENDQGHKLYECKLAHSRGTIKNFTKQWSPGTPVAVETVATGTGWSMRSKRVRVVRNWSTRDWPS